MSTRPNDTPPLRSLPDSALRIAPVERVRFDTAPLVALFAELGEQGAEDTVYAVLADISRRLGEIEGAYRRHSTASLPDAARDIAAAADRIGLATVARVARTVAATAAQRDPAALGATLARLRRVTDHSLARIWDAEES